MKSAALKRRPHAARWVHAHRIDRGHRHPGDPDRAGHSAWRGWPSSGRKSANCGPILWELRDAIDRYKDAADRGAFQIKVGTEGYPPDLDTLVKGVDVGGKKVRFLRQIPVDPMTNSTDWGLRSMQDDPDSDSWGGDNVFDVYTKSQGTGSDGTQVQGLVNGEDAAETEPGLYPDRVDDRHQHHADPGGDCDSGV